MKGKTRNLKIRTKLLAAFTFMSVVGLALGIAAAFLFLCNLKPIIQFLQKCDIEAFPPGIYGLDKVPWKVTPLEVGMVVLLVLVSSTAFAALFAWRAARLDPVTALRKE
jgi:lipoprotein-releasing system permease protein